MQRLTEQQDKLLQQLVRTDSEVQDIAVEVGVSAGTVINIRKACVIVDAMSVSMKEKIRRLLWTGTPAPQIAATLSVSAASVRNLRRLDRFRSLSESVSECSKCGTKFFAPTDFGAPGRRRERIRGHISQDDIRLLCDVTTDLLGLSDLHLITHPLFHYLSQRAEKVYRKIHVNKNTDSR